MKNRHLGAIIAVLCGIGAVVFVIYRWRTSGFAWHLFLAALSDVDWRWLALALVLVLLTYFGRALRWEIMLRPLTPNPSLWRVLVATCIGFAAVVLFGRAGEPVRPYLIAKKENVSFSSQVAAWLVERILDLLMVLVIFGIALTQISKGAIDPGPRFESVLHAGGYFAGLVGIACLALLVGMRQFRGRVRARLTEAMGFLPAALVAKIDKFLTAFEEGMASTRNSSFIWLLVFYTVLEWLVIIGATYCTFRAFPVTSHLEFTDAIITLGFMAFGSIVQIPAVGGGMQIATVLILTEFYGLSLEAATGIALVIWINTFVIIVPIGLALAFNEGIKWRSLKTLGASSSGYSL